jgi:hypothetical protein
MTIAKPPHVNCQQVHRAEKEQETGESEGDSGQNENDING